MGSRVDIYLEPHMPKSLDSSITKFAPHLFPSTASHSPALSSCPQKNQQPIVTSLSGCTTPSSRESTSYRPNKQGQALNMYAHRIFHDGGQPLPICTWLLLPTNTPRLLRQDNLLLHSWAFKNDRVNKGQSKTMRRGRESAHTSAHTILYFNQLWMT